MQIQNTGGPILSALYQVFEDTTAVLKQTLLWSIKESSNEITCLRVVIFSL